MKRLEFAHQLRAIAVISVMLSHLIGVFWGMPADVEAATRSPPQAGAPPFYFHYFDHPSYEAGPFGVALFFLISGLVIPLSLRNRSVSGFLLGRVVRLWPTYTAALCVDVVVVAASARHWGRPYGLSFAAFWQNLLLVYNYTGQFSIDLVNWSLGVETRFYLVIAFAVLLCRDLPPRVVLSLCLTATVGSLLYRLGGAPATGPVQALALEAMYVQFMLIGCLFQAHYVGRLSSLGLAASVGIAGALFAVSWRAGPLASLFPVVTYSYGGALGVFALAYAMRRVMPRLPPLERVADISYPVYLVQSIVGYSVLKLLMLSAGLAYTPALLATIASVLAVATVLHIAIERPTMRMAHSIGRSAAKAAMA